MIVIHRTVTLKIDQIVSVQAEDEDEALNRCRDNDETNVHVIDESTPRVVDIEANECLTGEEEFQRIEGMLATLEANGLIHPERQFKLYNKYYVSKEHALKFWKPRLGIVD